LVTKGFVIPFKSGVVVITDWKENNWIQSDRYRPTLFQTEKDMIIEEVPNKYCLLENNKKERPEWYNNRQKVIQESSLPYSFSYKIRNAFRGKECPICGNTMEEIHNSRLCKPSIQHNLPIKLGGKHELGNISVICYKCNLSIKDNPTDKLNSDEVTKVWETIVSNRDTQVRLGKVRLGKDTKNSGINPQVNGFIDLFKDINPSYSKLFANKTQRGCAERLLKTHGLEKLEKLVKMLPKINQDKYAPVITTPLQLEDKFGQLIAYGQKKQNNNHPII
jgi:hypothetical protein